MIRTELRAALQRHGLAVIVAKEAGLSKSAVLAFKNQDVGPAEKIRAIARVLPTAMQKWETKRFETINDQAAPCPRGHTSRYYSSNACTECTAERNATRQDSKKCN